MNSPEEPAIVDGERQGSARLARRLPSAFVASALASALLIASCGEKDDAAAPAPQADTAGQSAPTVTADWQRLADGSFLRASGTNTSERQEVDRCWPAGAGFDCLNVDEINFETGHIIVAVRTRPDAIEATLAMPPAQGFSCAIYPKVVEQRLIGAGGDAEALHNDDTDGSLWSAAEVAQLQAKGGIPKGGFIDCKALASAMAGQSVTALVSNPGFAPAAIIPAEPS